MHEWRPQGECGCHRDVAAASPRRRRDGATPPHCGSRMAPPPQKCIKMLFQLASRFLIDFGWILEPTWPPKPTQKRANIDQKSDHFLDRFFDCFLIDLGSIFEAKLVPKSIQNQLKNQPKKSSILSSIFGSFCDPFLMQTGYKSTWLT